MPIANFVLLMAFAAFSTTIAAKNALLNPGFENSTLEWFCWGGRSSDQGRSGKGAAMVENFQPKWSGLHQVVPIADTVKTVAVTGWIKTQNVIPGKEEWEKARIAVEFVDDKEQLVGGYPPVVGQAEGTTGWTWYRKRLGVPQGATGVKVIPALGNATGKAWFDDLTLELIGENKNQANTGANKGNALQNPGFEADVEGWTCWGGNISNIRHSGNLGLWIQNSKAAWSGVDQKIVIPKNTAEVEISGWMKTEDVSQGKENYEKARISIEFLDPNGKLVDGYPPVTGEAIGTKDWALYQKTYEVPSGAGQVKLLCALANTTGKAWFDDLSVVLKNTEGEVLKAGFLTGIMDAGEWYPLTEGDSELGGHYVDWSSLLDPPAGKHGFLRVIKGRLQFSDGTPAKFWGTNLVAGDIFASKAEVDSSVARLAKMGCNLVRLHHMDAPWFKTNIFGNTGGTRSLHPESLEKLDYLIAACKKKGIYIYLDLLVHRSFYPKDGVTNPPGPDNKGAKQSAHFSRKLIELQKEYITQLLTHVNAYTKKAYKDEPAIVGSEIINESSIFTYFEGDVLTPFYRKELQAIWRKADNKGSPVVFGLDWSGGKGRLKAISQGGEPNKSLRFLHTLETGYFREMASHLRKMDVRYPLSGSNFPVAILSSLKSNASLDMIISNFYWDHPQLWKINNDYSRIYQAPFDNRSQLRNPAENIVTDKAWYKVKGKPFLITEWNHCYPNEYVLEGVPLLAAFGALQAWDGILQFDFNHQTLGGNRIRSYTLSVTPEDAAMWVVAAPLFLRGDIAAARHSFVESVSDSQVLSLPSHSGLVDDNWHIPFITRVEKQFNKKSRNGLKKFNKYYNKKNGIITSETGELTYNTKDGTIRLEAGRVQGAFGFIGGQTFDFPALSFAVKNTHAGVLALSADYSPLVKAKKFYLVVVGPAKMTGQRYNASRTGLVSEGNLPVLAQVIEGDILLKSKKGALKLIPLNPKGEKGKALKLKKHKSGWSFNPGEGRTHVYLVTVR